MYPHSLDEFDNVIQKCVREMEKKHNCWIFISNDDNYWYMSVLYLNIIKKAEYIKLTSLEDSKFKTATAIRRYFRV